METQTSTEARIARPAVGQGNAGVSAKHETYITPYLPPQALAVIKAHMQQMRQPVMLRVLAQTTRSDCPNCAGAGALYVVFCKEGPYPYVPSPKNVSTWFDGNGQFGKGWYVVDRTVAYACPECKKKGA